MYTSDKKIEEAKHIFVKQGGILRTSEAIKKLVKLQAKTARVIRDGKELQVPI